ncbi:MAG: hypothetical protein K0R57_2394 [Paenibacillaceae bacterium]|jgi:membrane protease YdiL (CAAX protease family)|nr:hypothetical protein [Paenibacillaceae bacterium]
MDVIKKQFKIVFDPQTEKALDKKDGWYAIAYFLYLMIFIYLLGLFMFKTSYINDLSRHFDNKYLFKNMLYFPIALLQILPVFLILYLRKQPVWTMGLTLRRLIPSIVIGIIACLPLNLTKLFNYIDHSNGFHLKGSEAFYNLVYFLVFIAFVEELIFRGFIQARVLRLVSNKYLAILIVAVMFSVMHIPFQMIKAQMGLIEFIAYDWPHLLITGLMHIYFVYIYTRTNNLVAPSIAHGLNDFIQTSIY